MSTISSLTRPGYLFDSGREPERGWLKTIGPVTEMSDGHGLVPIVFLGPSEARGGEKIVRSFLESLDPDA
jgi:hypothetical protein